ncbi:LacI family DNA-binding transcriptional regulator [Brenneria tiliae]|uniref:LacI family transcriptional regulator n=1 Tax=Brenneria tiliae TaxID=2914984 RepID=A0ABT0MVU6_9GAMM|nr:LacI family DNA-binding transcriptional regulator [Brenneria tiliae]MCL2893413.1 LacI family transcriptional regulator [Brenneria tiliae]
MSKPVRIRDVASAAGFSVGAVSRALKGQPGIGDKPRQHIIQLAQAMGYDFSRLHSSKIQRVLFILHHQHNISMSLSFYTPLLMEVEAACREKNIALSFLALGPTDEVEKLVRQHNPDGLLIVGYLEPEILLALRGLQLPLALIDLMSPDLNSVNPDNLHGGYLATRHLIDLGRRNIAFLASSLAHYSIQQRERGYRQALYEAEVLTPPEYEAIAPIHLPAEQGLETATLQLISLPRPPDGLFAYNDAAALIALRTCKRAGLRVPDDIAIIGFDDVDSAALAEPPLSTVRVDRCQLGRRGLELLLTDSQAEQQLIDVKLCVRASTAASCETNAKESVNE